MRKWNHVITAPEMNEWSFSHLIGVGEDVCGVRKYFFPFDKAEKHSEEDGL